MKTLNFVLVAVGFFGSGWIANAAITPTGITVEVPIEEVMAPAQGYDDNDNVQVVVHGALPNACYNISRTIFEYVDPTTVLIKQYAIKKMDGVCAEERLIPEYMKMIVPYSTELSMGRMSANGYKFVYADATGEKKMRGIDVKVATVPMVDDFNYALVTQGMVSEVHFKNQEVKVTLSGVLNSTCTKLDDAIKVEKVDDVFVIMPMLKVDKSLRCAQMLRPFSREVTLGMLPVGHYLVHTRSMNGRSVNRVFQVVE
jgi:hypothetical protein